MHSHSAQALKGRKLGVLISGPPSTPVRSLSKARSFSKLSRVSGGILGFARYFCSCTTEKCVNGCLDPSPAGDSGVPYIRFGPVSLPPQSRAPTASHGHHSAYRAFQPSTNYARVNVFMISIHEVMHVPNPNKQILQVLQPSMKIDPPYLTFPHYPLLANTPLSVPTFLPLLS
jgi:hypothetical protein